MANNQYVNKVQYGSNTLIDLTSDTVTSLAMLQGYTAHDASGASIIGSIADGDELGYGNSSYLVGTARIGTGYAWTTYSGDICIAGSTLVGEGSAV